MPILCFGDEPFWSISFGNDGGAICDVSCNGPAGLRATNVRISPTGDIQGFELVTSEGSSFQRAVMRRTGKCSDGMSDTPYPYVFSGIGKPGSLSGCCRIKS